MLRLHGGHPLRHWRRRQGCPLTRQCSWRGMPNDRVPWLALRRQWCRLLLLLLLLRRREAQAPTVARQTRRNHQSRCWRPGSTAEAATAGGKSSTEPAARGDPAVVGLLHRRCLRGGGLPALRLHMPGWQAGDRQSHGDQQGDAIDLHIKLLCLRGMQQTLACKLPIVRQVSLVPHAGPAVPSRRRLQARQEISMPMGHGGSYPLQARAALLGTSRPKQLITYRIVDACRAVQRRLQIRLQRQAICRLVAPTAQPSGHVPRLTAQPCRLLARGRDKPAQPLHIWQGSGARGGRAAGDSGRHPHNNVLQAGRDWRSSHPPN